MNQDRSRPDHAVGVALVGCGRWGRNLARNFAGLGALVAVCDVDAAAAAAIGSTHGVPAVALDDLLSDPSVEALAIAAPAAEHAAIAHRAIEASKHVFVEKPFTLDVHDAEALCTAAEASGLTLMVGHVFQYHPCFLKLEELVQEGRLGRLQYLASTRLDLGTIRRKENILWSFAPHDVSMILSLVQGVPSSVWAVGSRYLHDEIADITTTHLAFPTGERAHIHVSWLHPFKEQRLVVIGDRGMAVFDDGLPWAAKLQLYSHTVSWKGGRPEPVRAEPEQVEVEAAEPLEAECRHFLDCVSSGTTPRTDGREGLRVLTVLHAAEVSMREHALAPARTPPTT